MEMEVYGMAGMEDYSNLGVIAPHRDKYIDRYSIDWLISEVKRGTPLKYATFWLAGEEEENYRLSQWYRGDPFTVNGRTYITAEQYMMSEEALLFNDMRSYSEIMKEPDPGKCKKLGKLVTGFDKKTWDSALREIIFHGNLAKLQSDIRIVGTLLETRNAVLVEASPYDDIYGAGLEKEDLLNPDGSLRVQPWEWHKRGETRQATNHLGFILMGLRDLFYQLIGYLFTPGMEEEKRQLWDR